jgi:hypothetical protein
VRRFYDHSFAFPDFVRKVEESGSNRARLESAQKDYFLRLLDAKFDDDYFEHRLRVGATHAVLNIEPRWNLGNYAVYCKLVFDELAKKLKGPKLVETTEAFAKVFMLDASLAVETYISEGVLARLVDACKLVNGAAGSMRDGTAQVDAAAREIANAAQEVARGATVQSSSLSRCAPSPTASTRSPWLPRHRPMASARLPTRPKASAPPSPGSRHRPGLLPRRGRAPSPLPGRA